MSIDPAAAALSALPVIAAENILRYAFGAGLIHLAVEAAVRAGTARRIRPGPPPGARQIRREIVASLGTIAVFIAVGQVIAYGAATGVFRLYACLSDHGWTWFLASTALLILGHDAWFYGTHRLMHRPVLYRRLHRLHHRSHRPTAFAAYSFDLSEALVHAAYLPVALLVLTVHPAAILIFTTHMILRNAIGHAGVEVFPADAEGRPRLPFLTTVTHHDLHHADGRWNLGLYFTWWDRIGGTEHPAYLARFAAAARRGATTAAPVLALALALALAVAGAGIARAETLRGAWATEGLGMVVRFEPCPGAPEETCGRIVHAWDPRLPVGLLLVEGLRAEGGGWSGRLTDPRSGAVFRGTIRRRDSDTLELEGCAGPLCRRQVWRSTRWLQSVIGGIRPPL
jgi:sterol desaturase/sphingolipid hydroxylase (fatty acid hydroxylase superfamily)